MVFAVAAAIRVAEVTIGAAVAPYRVGGDATLYDELARSLLAGRGLEHSGHQTGIVGPGYPAFVALMYATSGGSLFAVQIAQAFAGGASAGLAGLIARRIGGTTAGLAAGAAVAVYPQLVLWTQELLTETVFTALSLLALWLLVEASVLRRLWLFAAAGIAIGVATLTRTETAAFAPAAAVYALALHRGRFGWAAAALMIVLPLVLVGPWVARNAATVGVATLSTESGSVLWLGYSPHAAEGHRDGYVYGEPLPGPVPESPTEAESYAIYMHAVADELRARPFAPLALLPAKAWNMFRPAFGGSRALTLLAVGGSWIGLVALAAYGAFAGRPRREIGYVYLYAAAVAALHLLTIAEIRYRMPIEAALAVPAGIGAATLVARAGRRWPRLAIAA
jgi:4-amino-4-deoxy-L-arabinose transferase-like glycosyltransferase